MKKDYITVKWDTFFWGFWRFEKLIYTQKSKNLYGWHPFWIDPQIPTPQTQPAVR